ncbi:glutamyl-tRNA reductase [Streptomyces blastmyceticus]|uniref:Glutamyl-tRNA reductase n=1 Tax=Streptomyces blastmyceticus TaxID=68180 RepID=A0ABP3G7Z3_9ACTN
MKGNTPDVGIDRIAVVGVSHATTPVSLLEEVALADDELDGVHAAISGSGGAAALVLATCNRLELYVESDDSAAASRALGELIARRAGAAAEEVRAQLHVRRGEEAVHHLFSVASGLESLVIGEDQILGQVKSALSGAQERGSAGRLLNQLGQKALRLGKRVRTETGINEAGRSLATLGLQRLERTLGALAGKSVLLVGAGSMGAVVAADLRRAGPGELLIANRTVERAERLAERYAGRAVPMERVPELLADVDLAVCCVGGTGSVIRAAHAERAVRARGGRELFLLDLAMPRNIDAEVAAVPGVVVVDLERLAETGPEAASAMSSLAAARKLVAEEVGEFVAAQRVARAAPVVAAMRSAASAVVSTEIDRLTQRMPDLGSQEHAEIARSVRRIVDKVLHGPTVRARQLAEEAQGELYVEVMVRLFAPSFPEQGAPGSRAGASAAA